MLRSNSKKARENVKQYIINNFSPESYTDTTLTEWHDIAEFIYNCFRSEKYNCLQDYRYFNSEYYAFCEWCQGLPSVLDTCYYYNRSAVNDLGEILEETEQEKSKYTESQAEKQLTILIYDTIKKELEQ